MSIRAPLRLLAVVLAVVMMINLPLFVSAEEHPGAWTSAAVADHAHDDADPDAAPHASADADHHNHHCMPSCQTGVAMLTEPPATALRSVTLARLLRPVETVGDGASTAPDPPPPRPVLAL